MYYILCKLKQIMKNEQQQQQKHPKQKINITKKTILIELLFSDIHVCKCKTMNT